MKELLIPYQRTLKYDSEAEKYKTDIVHFGLRRVFLMDDCSVNVNNADRQITCKVTFNKPRQMGNFEAVCRAGIKIDTKDTGNNFSGIKLAVNSAHMSFLAEYGYPDINISFMVSLDDISDSATLLSGDMNVNVVNFPSNTSAGFFYSEYERDIADVDNDVVIGTSQLKRGLNSFRIFTDNTVVGNYINAGKKTTVYLPFSTLPPTTIGAVINDIRLSTRAVSSGFDVWDTLPVLTDVKVLTGQDIQGSNIMAIFPMRYEQGGLTRVKPSTSLRMLCRTEFDFDMPPIINSFNWLQVDFQPEYRTLCEGTEFFINVNIR